MWHYVIRDLTDDANSKPAVPPGVRAQLLARPGHPNARWGIYRCDAEIPASGHVKPLPPETEALIRAADDFPPALALVRDDVDALFDRHVPTNDELSARYAERLARRLREKETAPYVVAEVAIDRPGSLKRGERYWVLRHMPHTGSVSWVSTDFVVYETPASTFHLTPQELRALSAPVAAR